MQLYELTAVEAAEGIKKGDFSPVELVQSHLDRIAATEPEVQAWEFVDEEGALRRARFLEGKLRQRPDQGPLFGVPVGIKDNWHVEGLATTANFPPYANNIAGEDSAVTQRFRDAGAIILGKTVTVQFATGLDSPKSRNPWNHERTPGGSSSGSAAAVGARQVAIAMGTQTGASLLRPAAYCGVVALKPTYGRISRYGLLPVSWSLDQPGPIVRSVADAAAVLQVQAFHDPRDPYSVKQPPEDFIAATRRPCRTPRFGLMVDLMERAEPDVREAMEKAVGQLIDAGAKVEEVRLPVPMDLMLAIHFLHRCSEVSAVHSEQYATLSQYYEPDLAANVEVGHVLPASIYINAKRLRRRFRSKMTQFVGSFDGLIGPTASNAAPDRSGGTGDPSFQVFVSLFGFPNMTLPTSVGRAGLPYGIQIVTSPFSESHLISVAQWASGVFEPLQLPA
jgi:aspartyl-tRNA(Asn)/glutamyl-tRNA(Gln) amidotransferase subunit A